MREVTSDIGRPLNSIESWRHLSASTPEPLASLHPHRPYMLEPRVAHEHSNHRPESSKLPTFWGRPEDSEPTLLDLVSRYPLRQEVTVKNGVRVVLYFCGVLQCNNTYGFSSEVELR